MRIFLKLAFLIGCQCFGWRALANDPFNSFLWNRSNHFKKNGLIEKRDWFEWWYYKINIPDTDESFFFTYGVVNPWDYKATKGGSRAEVTIGSFKENSLMQDILNVDSFKASYAKTEVHVGSQSFASDQRIVGEVVNKNGQKASWDLKIDKVWGFNAMGWAMSVPDITNIFWYPAQASATMSGWINYQGKHFEINKAPAYQDRNWGRSFPKWWTWLVSNNFKNNPETVLAAGGGRPLVANRFDVANGLTIGLKHNGKLYEFRTPDGDNIQMNVRFGKWEVEARNSRGEKIQIHAYAPKEKFLLIPFSTPTGEMFYDYEALRGFISVKIFRKKSLLNPEWIKIAELETDEGGIEFGSPSPNPSQLLFNQNLNLE